MEFFGELDDQLKPCHHCGKMTWIYVKKHDNNKDENYYCCNEHYLEILKRYYNTGDTSGFEIFPQELNLLELPVQAAQSEFGTNIPIKYLVQMYFEKLEEKLKQIDLDLKRFESNFDPINEDFINLLKNDKSEKEVLLFLSRILIKEYKFS